MELLLRPLLWLFGWLVSRGGEPRAQGGGRELVFPLRPGTLWFLLGSIVGCAWLLVRYGPMLWHGDWRQVGWVALGVFLGFVAVSLLTTTVRLDADGLRVHRGLGRDKLIRWGEFSHFERYHSRQAGRDTLYIRSVPHGLTGEVTTVTLPEMTYNVTAVVEAIRRGEALPERPRQKRHWWGG